MTARIFGLRFSIFYAFLTIGTGMQLPFLPLWLHAKGLTVAEIGLVIAGMTACRGGTYLVMAAASLAALSFAFALKRVSPKVLVPLGT